MLFHSIALSRQKKKSLVVWHQRSHLLYSNSDLQLANWVYWPVIEQGTGAWINYGFWANPRPTACFFVCVTRTNPARIYYGDATDAALVNGGLTNLELYQQSQGGGAEPAAANPVGLTVFSP